jgi:hypothetical protein
MNNLSELYMKSIKIILAIDLTTLPFILCLLPVFLVPIAALTLSLLVESSAGTSYLETSVVYSVRNEH